MRVTAGVDVGGTFTDVVLFEGGSISGRKVPTSAPQDRAVAEALASADVEFFLHGTTVATNQVLEEDGARVALVTSRGFEDVIEIGRQARPSLYDTFDDRPTPLVDREMRIGIERDDLDSVLARIQELAPEAVAVSLVRSYDDPTTELELARMIEQKLGFPVSVGARVSPPFREFERVATTALNAYLTPTVASYLRVLDRSLPDTTKMVMTSAGGLVSFEAGSQTPGRLVLSGPAAGVVASAELGRAKGYDSVISFDMGGTSTDVCRIEGGATSMSSHQIADRVNRVPSMPIRTIGAGGGSIAWLDPGGALRVGPQSAGAEPGPASYGHGGVSPTVTDANVVIGAVPDSVRLGGKMRLDVGAGRIAVAGLAGSVGLGAEEAAEGILEVVDQHMQRALRAVSIEEGADPRRSVLVAFGGAGGLHASRLASSLGIGTILIPPLSGVFSALGLLLAAPRTDRVRTVLLAEGDPSLGDKAEVLLVDARSSYVEDGVGDVSSKSVSAEVRYVGQSHELAVPLGPGWDELRTSFEKAHEAKFGFVRESQPIELVNLRAEVVGKAPLSWDDLPELSTGLVPRPGTTSLWSAGSQRDVDLWARGDLPAGFECKGPALIVDDNSVVRLEEGDRLGVHGDGTLEIHRGAR